MDGMEMGAKPTCVETNGGKGSANTVVPAAHPIIVALLFYGRFWVAAGLR